MEKQPTIQKSNEKHCPNYHVYVPKIEKHGVIERYSNETEKYTIKIENCQEQVKLDLDEFTIKTKYTFFLRFCKSTKHKKNLHLCL